MKIGFFSSIITDGNPTTGFEIANEAIVQGLRELGHDVTVIGFKLPRQGTASDPKIQILDTLNLENSGADRLKKIEWVARALAKSLPMSAAKLTHISHSKFDELVEAAGPFDAHIVNSYQLAAAFPQILNKPYAYVAHNVEYRSAEQNAITAGSKFLRILYRRDARLLEKIEHELCSNAGFVWTLSADDLETLRETIKDGIDLPLVTPLAESTGGEAEKIWDIGLIGTWSWQPNFVGLQWFLDEVIPHLPEGLKIAVAGSTPDGVLKDCDNVTFLGRVESAAEFLNSARVVPLVSRGGTGVQLKTIEAFQAGHACVATSSSVRGIKKLPANCVEADEPVQFAQALSKLVNSSVNNTLVKSDGRSFHADQKSAMLDCLARGVVNLK